jgi:hypothetical protein
MGANDAPGQGLQSAQKKQASNYIFVEIMGISILISHLSSNKMH